MKFPKSKVLDPNLGLSEGTYNSLEKSVSIGRGKKTVFFIIIYKKPPATHDTRNLHSVKGLKLTHSSSHICPHRV